MNRVVSYLVRFVVMLIGYGVACLAASAFLAILMLGAFGFSAEEVRWMGDATLLVTVPLLALFLAYAAFTPSALVILLGELLARRDWLSHALGGGAVGLATAAWYRGALPLHPGTPAHMPDSDLINPLIADPRFLALAAGSGIVGGVFYWLTAGRWAGGWRDPGGGRPTSPAP